MRHTTFPELGQRTLDELLDHWPEVVRHAETDWARGFARSIAHQARRPLWQPSPKQLALMRRMVSDLFVQRGDDEDVRLIEGED